MKTNQNQYQHHGSNEKDKELRYSNYESIL